MQILSSMIQIQPSNRYTGADVPFSSGRHRAAKPHSTRAVPDSRPHNKSMIDRDTSRMSATAKKLNARMASARQASATYLEMKKKKGRLPLNEYIHQKQAMDRPAAPTPSEIPGFEVKIKNKKLRSPQLKLDDSDGRNGTIPIKFADVQKADYLKRRNNSLNDILDRESYGMNYPHNMSASHDSIKRKVEFSNDPASLIFRESSYFINEDKNDDYVRNSLVERGHGGNSHRELSKKDVDYKNEISQDFPVGHK